MDFIQGEIIAIDKPYGITSFAALAHVRYVLSKYLGVKRVKIGHAGTLDPLATGVLLLCTGKKTKEIEQLQSHTKEYITDIQLGSTTVSHDMEHPINETFSTSHINGELISNVLKNFIGNIEQIPPSYSACKVDGKRAYDLKRKGQEVELRSKQVRIDDIEVLNFDRATMVLTLRVVCGKGTYIRALARDVGQQLDSGAYLKSLRRTRVGDMKVENCINYNQFKEWLITNA